MTYTDRAQVGQGGAVALPDQPVSALTSTEGGRGPTAGVRPPSSAPIFESDAVAAWLALDTTQGAEDAGGALEDFRDLRQVLAQAPPASKRRGVRWPAVAVVAVVATGAGAVAWQQSETSPLVSVADPQVAADAADRKFAAAAAQAARMEEIAALRAARAASARDLLAAGQVVLDGSAGRVVDDAVRQDLARVLFEAQRGLDAGELEAAWGPIVHLRLPQAQDAVIAAQTAWQAAEDARLAAEEVARQAEADRVAQQNKTTPRIATPRTNNNGGGGGGTTQSAPQQRPQTVVPSTSFYVNPLATNSNNPGRAAFRISVETSTPVSVTLTVAGRSKSLGTVSSSQDITGEITGLPAGNQSWTVTVGSLSNSGSIQVF